MRRHRPLPNSWTVYADQLLLILGYFMIIATLLILVPHLKSKTDGLKPKAEYLVVLSWDNARNVDLDLWLKRDRCIVMYQNRECANISLDRDSRGYLTNHEQRPDGSFAVSPNQEVIAIRAVMPGDYLAAVSYYDGRDSTTGYQYAQGAPDEHALIDARVELIKLNPTVAVVQQATLHLTRTKETRNAIGFHVADDGAVALTPLPEENMIDGNQTFERESSSSALSP